MSFETEQNKRKLKQELQKREVKLSKLFEETYQQQKAQHSLDGCFNTLISAVTVLEKEHKKAIADQNAILEKAMQQALSVVNEAKKINAETINTINEFQSCKVIDAMDEFRRSVYQRKEQMYKYLGEEVENMRAANRFLRSNMVSTLWFMSFFVGGIGGIIYFVTFSLSILNKMFGS